MLKKILTVVFSLYISLASFAICFYMIEGEINLKKICIQEKGLIKGLLLGCDSLNPEKYKYELSKRLAIYGVKGLIFPYYIIREN